jgi:hypothetical protein
MLRLREASHDTAGAVLPSPSYKTLAVERVAGRPGFAGPGAACQCGTSRPRPGLRPPPARHTRCSLIHQSQRKRPGMLKEPLPGRTQNTRSGAARTTCRRPGLAARSADSCSSRRLDRVITWTGFWPSAGTDGCCRGGTRIMAPARAGCWTGEVAMLEAFADLSTPQVADACLRCGVPLRAAHSGIRPVVAGDPALPPRTGPGGADAAVGARPLHQRGEHADVAPLGEVVDRLPGPELPGHLPPLAAGTEPPDDALKLRAGAAGRGRNVRMALSLPTHHRSVHVAPPERFTRPASIGQECARRPSRRLITQRKQRNQVAKFPVTDSGWSVAESITRAAACGTPRSGIPSRPSRSPARPYRTARQAPVQAGLRDDVACPS